MAKKALCIGINNYPGTGNDLWGCVNDANDWRAALEKRGFTVQQLLDSQATKDAMHQSIQSLVQGATSGDVIVITYSGHGSWIPDLDNDEPDARDEVLCPYDISQNRPFTDDELYNIFTKRERDVRIVFISDSCNSGTLNRYVSTQAVAARPLTRFLPPAYFLPPDMLQVAAERATHRAANVSRLFGGVFFSGCQDIESSYDAEFNGRPNGAFTYFALEALNTLETNATYQEWHETIRRSLPNRLYPQNPNLQGTQEQITWKIFEGEKSMQSTANSITTQSTSSLPGQTPWRQWGRIQQPRARISNLSTTPSLTDLPDGTYVTALGSSNTLFRLQRGHRQLIDPADIAAMGITQNDIQQVDPLELRLLPLEVTRQRAIGRDLQRYLWSNLGANHHMQSWVWLQGTTLTVRTITETGTWFGGYAGGVSVILYDAGGNRILHDQIRYRYGIDGRAFGPGSREDSEVFQLPQNVADAAESILICHYWDPKVDLVAAAIEWGGLIWEVIQIIIDAYSRGEAVNAGGDEF